MSAGSAAKLYTPEILGLATQLAAFPLSEDMQCRGEARSRTCGSTLSIGLEVDDKGAVTRLGLRASACAIGQAAASIFAQDVKGRTRADIERALVPLEAWLSGAESAPVWQGIQVLDAARAHPARHGAIMLAWKAAIEALPKH